MKHFKLEIEGIDFDWHLLNASDVMYQIRKRPGCNFRIYWKTPVTGAYALIVKKTYHDIAFNRNFKLPKTFSQLVNE